MKINTNDIDIGGTHLQGYVSVSYQKLCKKLGPPIRSNGDKVQAEWVLEEDGVIATIYDWKEYGRSPEFVTDWHIGGHDSDALTLVRRAVGSGISRLPSGNSW